MNRKYFYDSIETKDYVTLPAIYKTVILDKRF